MKQINIIFLFVLILSHINGCGSSPRFNHRSEAQKERQISDPQPPESVNVGKRSLLSITGIASYYAHAFDGRKTSNGEIYDMNGFTAAHRNFPFQTRIRVTNLENNLSVVVRINDRGPFVEGRLLDLSLGAAKQIEMLGTGTAKIKIEVIEWGDGS